MIDIKNIIKEGEGERVEFKKSFDKEAIETITAFANSEGGTLIIGVNDNGSITGVDVSSEKVQQYINQVKNGTEPPLIVDIESVTIEKKNIMITRVNEFPIKPVNFKGRYFKRVLNSNHQMTPIEISNLQMQSLQLSWDSYPAADSLLGDLDPVKINNFFDRVNKSGRFRLNGTMEENLGKLNLLKDGNPVNAAKLLFSREQTVYNIHIGRFKTPSMILDDKMIKNTLFEAVEEAMYYLLSHIKVAFEITGEIERNEIFEYPREALRELVLNAIVHRDYTSPVDTQIKIFDNAVTFFNPGNLYGDLTIEQLKTDSYQSRTRNKLIAEAFYLTGDIEKYGSGYIRIRKAISDYPTMKFEYSESGNGFLVGLSYEKQRTTQKATQKATQKTTQKSTRDLIVDLLTADPEMTREMLAEKIGVSPDAVKQHLAKLKNDGVIRRIGGRKEGKWEVLKD